MSDQLVIDLITISAYAVNGSQVLVPQRVEAERQHIESSSLTAARSKVEGQGVEGVDDFIAAIDVAPQASRPLLRHLSNWALAQEPAKLVRLTTYHGRNGVLTLLPRLVADNAG